MAATIFAAMNESMLAWENQPLHVNLFLIEGILNGVIHNLLPSEDDVLLWVSAAETLINHLLEDVATRRATNPYKADVYREYTDRLTTLENLLNSHTRTAKDIRGKNTQASNSHAKQQFRTITWQNTKEWWGTISEGITKWTRNETSAIQSYGRFLKEGESCNDWILTAGSTLIYDAHTAQKNSQLVTYIEQQCKLAVVGKYPTPSLKPAGYADPLPTTLDETLRDHLESIQSAWMTQEQEQGRTGSKTRGFERCDRFVQIAGLMWPRKPATPTVEVVEETPTEGRVDGKKTNTSQSPNQDPRRNEATFLPQMQAWVEHRHEKSLMAQICVMEGILQGCMDRFLPPGDSQDDWLALVDQLGKYLLDATDSRKLENPYSHITAAQVQYTMLLDRVKTLVDAHLETSRELANGSLDTTNRHVRWVVTHYFPCKSYRIINETQTKSHVSIGNFRGKYVPSCLESQLVPMLFDAHTMQLRGTQLSASDPLLKRMLEELNKELEYEYRMMKQACGDAMISNNKKLPTDDATASLHVRVQAVRLAWERLHEETQNPRCNIRAEGCSRFMYATFALDCAQIAPSSGAAASVATSPSTIFFGQAASGGGGETAALDTGGDSYQPRQHK